MRKTFQLKPEGKHPDRHLEAVKHEIRKYIQREKRRDLDYWAFDCRFGADTESAQAIHVEEITPSIDGVVKAEGTQFYIEILARAAKRGPRGERKVLDKSADGSGDDEADAED